MSHKLRLSQFLCIMDISYVIDAWQEYYCNIQTGRRLNDDMSPWQSPDVAISSAKLYCHMF